MCFFLDFRSRCTVTSGDDIPHSSNARDLGIILGASASVRGSVQHPVFSVMRGDWGAVWGLRTHKPASPPDCVGPGVQTCKILGCFLIDPFGPCEKTLRQICKRGHVTSWNNRSIVFAALWLVTPAIGHVYYSHTTSDHCLKSYYKRS